MELNASLSLVRPEIILSFSALALLLLAAIYFIRVQGVSLLKFVKFSLDESKAAE